MVKYNIGLKTLLLQGISEPIFYGDLVDKFKIIVRILILVINSKRLSNVIKKKLDITRISYDSLNPITGLSCGFLSNCTTVGQTSDSMTSPT